MKILLITENPTIQKLFSLSAEKKGDEVSVGNKESIPDENYDVVFLDKEVYSKETFDNLKKSFPSSKFVLILNKNEEKIPGFDEFLQKPFLPTDLIDMLENINENKKSAADVGEDEFDLESFEEIPDAGDFDEKNDDEDFLISDDELEKEVEESDEDEDFIIDESELEEDKIDDEEEFLKEDITEEKALENEEENFDMEDLEEIEEMPQETSETSEEIENVQEQESEELFPEKTEETAEKPEEIQEIPESEPQETEYEEPVVSEDFEPEENEGSEEENEIDLSELEKIDENELASAIGEEIENSNVLEPENENFEEKEKTQEITEKAPVLEKEKTIEEKTLGNILNINWEELKKAKAKVTITIDFGDNK